jgi:hypothetical protein
MIGRLLCRSVTGLVLLSGCAAAQPAAVRSTPEPRCSFRSAVTCWTFAARFPVRRVPPAPAQEQLRVPAPAVLASAPDTIAVSQ